MSAGKRTLQLLSGAVADGVFPGAVLLVARQKDIVLFEAVGNAALTPTERPMSHNTCFDLASLTKPFATTLAVLHLVSAGKVQLDASLAELLPSRRIPTDKQPITLRQLLCHCSGLPAWKPYYLWLDTLPRQQRKAQLRLRILKEPLHCTPGHRAVYSDLGFLLIEWILEENTGQDLHSFTRQHLFGPLGCNSLGYLPLHHGNRCREEDFAATEHCPWRGSVLSGLVHDENAYVLGGIAGHAGLFGTATEVKHLLDAILDTLSSSAKHLIWTREHLNHFLQPARLDPVSTWALGFDTPATEESSSGRHFSPETVGHLGFTGTSFWLDLQQEIAVILLTNRIHPSRSNNKIKKFRPTLHDAVMEECG